MSAGLFSNCSADSCHILSDGVQGACVCVRVSRCSRAENCCWTKLDTSRVEARDGGLRSRAAAVRAHLSAPDVCRCTRLKLLSPPQKLFVIVTFSKHIVEQMVSLIG